MHAIPEPARPSKLRRRLAARARVAPTHAFECARCGRDFLATVRTERVDDGHRRILQRCGSCEGLQVVVLGNTQAALLQTHLDGQRAAMAAELERLDRERMADEVETLAVALDRDLIDASDFARCVRR
jgi:hypothetical protein